MGALSFHETKNLTSGEGGSLLLNHDEFIERAEIVWEKGTNRKQFFLNKADKYTWVDVGSSFLPSELTAAMLYAQLEDTLTITRKRLAIWEQYHTAFEALEQQGHIVRPVIPADCQHNAHIYYILLPNLEERDRFIDTMQTAHIGVVFHYVPLHSSPAGQKFGRAVGDLPNTQRAGERLVRLPLWPDMLPEQVTYIIDKVTSYFS
jgi:dTDP-4-amino-4,6-dideoxygalactose transaminase